jgi:putative DNA primase/helicase
VFGSGVFASCLIALMRDPVTDAPVGIQRIALEERDGRVEKIERKMLGQAGIVKLWPAGRTLVVGEGLETVLAAATRIPFEGVSLIPAWAAMSKGGLAQLPVIDGVERLLLLADNDSNGAGQAAAEACKRRWQAAGRAVVILMPDAPDSDFNDLVIEEDARASHA